MSRAFTHFLADIAGQAWAIEPSYGRQALGALEARMLHGERWSDDERNVRISEGNRRYDAAAMPMPTDGMDSGSRQGNVFVLPLFGVLRNRIGPMEAASGGGGTGLAQWCGQMADAAANPAVNCICILADSPGGSVNG